MRNGQAIVLLSHSEKAPATSACLSDFKDSRGWFEKFKRLTVIRTVTRLGEGANLDKSGSNNLCPNSNDYVEAKEFMPQLR